MRLIKRITIILFTLLCLVGVPALAQQKCGTNGSQCVTIENPIKGVTTVPQLLGTIIRGALGIIGALTLLMLVWGGFQWLTSAGNAEKVEHGTQTMLWAVIGVIVVFSSYVLVDQLTSLLKK